MLHAPGTHSEIGTLRRAVIHRPGLELSRLTRSNSQDLFFEDALWAARAREEHNGFAQVLMEHDVAVLYFEVLLAEALESDQARAFVVDRVCTAEQVGHSLVAPLRELAEGVDAATLAELLIGGVRRCDLVPAPGSSLRWQSLQENEFVLDPLANTLFQRDNAAWVYGGLTINPMASRARQRESVNSRAVYQFHPEFVASSFPTYFGADDACHTPAAIEGGDIHVLGRGVVMIGMSDATTAAAVEILARELFHSGQAQTVIAVRPPSAHRSHHLDSMLTMLDIDTFVLYPHLDPRSLQTWKITSKDPHSGWGSSSAGLQVEACDDLFATIAHSLGTGTIRVLSAGVDAPSARDEQWDDANNYLALAPGIVIGYERNTMTNTMLRDHGIKVISIPGSELGQHRSRSGVRSMSCPVQRDGI